MKVILCVSLFRGKLGGMGFGGFWGFRDCWSGMRGVKGNLFLCFECVTLVFISRLNFVRGNLFYCFGFWATVNIDRNLFKIFDQLVNGLGRFRDVTLNGMELI